MADDKEAAMSENESGGSVRDALLERFKFVRPNLRSEYMETIGRTAPPGLDPTVFKEKVFDYERAPYIEKKGIEQATAIVEAVSDFNFPDSAIYLLTCLIRLELYFYESLRPEKNPDPSLKDERRTLMYKTGVRKIIRETAAMLPNPSAWKRRRQLLNFLENDLWRIDLGTADSTIFSRLDETMRLADILHSMTPSTIATISSPEELDAKFISIGGSGAADIAKSVPSEV